MKVNHNAVLAFSQSQHFFGGFGAASRCEISLFIQRPMIDFSVQWHCNLRRFHHNEFFSASPKITDNITRNCILTSREIIIASPCISMQHRIQSFNTTTQCTCQSFWEKISPRIVLLSTCGPKPVGSIRAR